MPNKYISLNFKDALDLEYVLNDDNSELEGLASDESDLDEIEINNNVQIDTDDVHSHDGVPDVNVNEEQAENNTDEIVSDFDSSDDEALSKIAGKKLTREMDYRWRKVNFEEPTDLEFQGLETIPIPNEDWTPYNYFKYFVNDEMLQSMSYQSNLYYMQKHAKPASIEPKELEQLIGIYLSMGLVQMPNQRSYWETYSGYSGVSDVMNRNHFEMLMKNIHFIDNIYQCNSK